MAKGILSKVGNPTVLATYIVGSNAGIVPGKSIFDSSENDIRFTFDVSTLAH